jgi:signal transduction histidine kinase
MARARKTTNGANRAPRRAAANSTTPRAKVVRAAAARGRTSRRPDYPALLARMERLIEISHTLASTLEQGKLLRQIVDAARELTGSEASSILLLDPGTQELRFEATTNLRASQLEGVTVPRAGSIAGWIVSNSRSLLVPDTRHDERWNPRVDELTAFETRSILGVPLIARDQTIGVLEALNKPQGAFNDDDAHTLQWLAAQAAVAIVNARLFQQSDLVAEMVHELRTPLSALMATGHLLLRSDLTDNYRRDLVATLQRETARLSQLTTDFLDMARLESGRARFRFEPFSLADLVNECVDVVRPQTSERGLQLTVQMPSDLPALESDRDKVKQVLLNLLTNAVKYNKAGGSIGVQVERLPAAGRVRVSVVDTGKGVKPEAVAHLFERFYRAPDSDHYATGTGLGLPIAKRIVETLGGEIGLHSAGAGSGSTFYFELPADGHAPGAAAG